MEKGPLSMLCLYVCLANLKGAYTLHKIFHGTENFPRTACAVRFFLKKKLYCACGPQKIFRSVENFMKCICTFNPNFHKTNLPRERIPSNNISIVVCLHSYRIFLALTAHYQTKKKIEFIINCV